jgi:hypothetical protein
MSQASPHPRNERKGGKRASSASRDQEPSTFTLILERLLAATPGSEAAVLVDSEGETVDYAGALEPFELKIAAAHWQIVLGELREEAPHLGAVRQIMVRARARSYLVRRVQERYAVVLVLHRHAAFAVSERALQEVDLRLCMEAGWPEPPYSSRWFGVEVETRGRGRERMRPSRLRVAGAWQPVEVLGAVVGLTPRERGFLVRLPSGAEMLLIRERLGRWYADEQVER